VIQVVEKTVEVPEVTIITDFVDVETEEVNG